MDSAGEQCARFCHRQCCVDSVILLCKHGDRECIRQYFVRTFLGCENPVESCSLRPSAVSYVETLTKTKKDGTDHHQGLQYHVEPPVVYYVLGATHPIARFVMGWEG